MKSLGLWNSLKLVYVNYFNKLAFVSLMNGCLDNNTLNFALTKKYNMKYKGQIKRQVLKITLRKVKYKPMFDEKKNQSNCEYNSHSFI